MDGGDRRNIRNALARDFGEVCAYCEQLCDSGVNSRAVNAETIDHFRPRSRFPHLQFDWSNLIYACYRCNQSKGNSWPGYDDSLINQSLSAMYHRYTSPSEYVSPNVSLGGRPAQEFFDFDVDTGEIFAANDLDDLEWSLARRTIRDIDLNDSELGENDPNHLMFQRRDELDQLIQRLSGLQDPEQQVVAVRDASRPTFLHLHARLSDQPVPRVHGAAQRHMTAVSLCALRHWQQALAALPADSDYTDSVHATDGHHAYRVHPAYGHHTNGVHSAYRHQSH